MKEIRLTFGSDDFGAVSKALVDLGVSFHVEPLEGHMAESVAAGPRPTPPVRRRASPKKAGRKNAKRGPKHENGAVSGADRLRQAVTGTHKTPARPPFEPVETPTSQVPGEITKGEPPRSI